MMDMGWRPGGQSFCKSKYGTVSHLLGERQAPECVLSIGRSACSTLVSTSGPTPAVPTVSWSGFHQGRGRRGKPCHATAGPTGQIGNECVADPIDVIENKEEFMEWRVGINKKDGQEDAGRKVETQNYSMAFAREEPNWLGKEEEIGLPSEGFDFNDSTRGEGELEVVCKQAEDGPQRGWRDLASDEDIRCQDISRPYWMKKAWRRQKIARQRLKGANSSPSTEKTDFLASNRDPNLEILFKSLSSLRRDKSFDIESYFGSEIDEKMSPNEEERIEDARMTTLPNSWNAGRENECKNQEGKPTRPTLSNGQERLKINLDLDLYRARCLKEEGRLKEAEAILKECIRDWQDDGRAFLALGLLRAPYSSGRTNPAENGFVVETNGDRLANKPVSDKESVTYVDRVDGDKGGVFSSPAVLGGGERLKINLDLDLYKAKCCKLKGRLDESKAIVRKCIRDWPDDGRPYVALGKLLLEQKKVQEARALYESGCQAVRGENPYIWQAWAVLEEKCGDVAKARKYFDAAIVADKMHVAAWHGWGVLELRAGNIKRAKSLLKKGLKICGPNEYIFQTLGILEFKEGNSEQARLFLSKATRHNPKSAPSWLTWALMESKCNSITTARRLFQKGLEASPKNRYVWQAWALFEAKQGRQERARELFERGRELNPRDVILLQAFALFEFECGRPGIARDYFRKALACDPTHQPVWIGWGWMEWKQRNLSVARELYRGAIQADSSSLDAARAFQAWGILEDEEGDTVLARELFRCALKVDSQNVPTWMSWAAMEEREGRLDRANEIRNLFLQQRTEVVEGPWDVDFSDLLAPAIDKIKGFFRADQLSPWQGNKSATRTDTSTGNSNDVEVTGSGTSLDASDSGDDEFDLDSFLKRTFPRKYGSGSQVKSTWSNFSQRSPVK